MRSKKTALNTLCIVNTISYFPVLQLNLFFLYNYFFCSFLKFILQQFPGCLLQELGRRPFMHIEVDLEMPIDLRGWGGAPVLHDESGQVVGILQANSPRKGPGRVSIGPIGGVIDALGSLPDAAAGR